MKIQTKQKHKVLGQLITAEINSEKVEDGKLKCNMTLTFPPEYWDNLRAMVERGRIQVIRGAEGEVVAFMLMAEEE